MGAFPNAAVSYHVEAQTALPLCFEHDEIHDIHYFCQQKHGDYRDTVMARTGEHVLIPPYDFVIRNLWEPIGFANMDAIRIYHSIRRDRREGRRLGKDHIAGKLAVHRTRESDTGSQTPVNTRLSMS